MPLTGKLSGNHRHKYASNDHQSLPSLAHLDAEKTQEGRTTPGSERSYEQYHPDSSSLRSVASIPLSTRFSAPYTHRVVHSSILSIDDISKCQLLPPQPHLKNHHQTLPSFQEGQLPTDQKKSRGLFDRMRPSLSRPSSSEAKPCPPGLTRRITSQDTITPAFRTNTNPILNLEALKTEWDTYLYPKPVDSSARGISQPDLSQQSEQANSVTPLKSIAKRPFVHADQSDFKPTPLVSTSDEPQQRHSFRESILNSFLKVPNRISGLSSSESSQQGLLNPKSSTWHRNSQSVSQISLISQEGSCSASLNDQNSDLSDQQFHYNSPSHFSRLETQQMAPHSSSITSRRTTENKLSIQLQQEARDNQSSNCNRSQFSNHQPTTPGLSPSIQGNQTQSHRLISQREVFNSSQNEQGQKTPTPPAQERDINDNYKELVTKYKKVKGLYFEKTAQVEQLQNTLANQRLSQSRTSLDDSEYMTRFQRLEGAVTNLAFNIRKDWQTIPAWLSQNVNHDAIKIGKQEMTAVGRAIITKFLVDEIFDLTFHPGLPIELSHSLKTIEKNIRKFCPTHNHEESEALTARMIQWRLTTLDGLKDILTLPESEQNKKRFIEVSTENLINVVTRFLQVPKPLGLEDSAHMIVELAVSIASNLPLESRDICIIHPMPGSVLQPTIMKVENPIPALVDTLAVADDNESAKSGNKDEPNKDKKGGVLQASLVGNSGGKKGEEANQKIRFSGFVGVEVRGRQVLYKAPVWTT